MASQTESMLFNVNTFTHGADNFPGITGINITKNLGRLKSFRKELELIGSIVRRVADDGRFAVEFTLQSKSRSVLFTLLDKDQAAVTVKATDAETGVAATISIANAIYDTAGGGITTSDDGQFQIHGVGSACTVADAA